MPPPRRWIAVAVLLSAHCIPRAASQAQVHIDVNRPHSPFQCDTPIGEQWYGSTERCLDELCGGKNVYNEWIFDENKRRRRNPCYGHNPTDFKGH